MARPLQMLLEREFRLCYHVPGFGLGNLRVTDSREVEWFHNRLIKQLRDEEKAYSDMQKRTPT